MDIQNQVNWTCGSGQIQGTIGGKWVFTRVWIDYNEVFAHVVRMNTVRMIIALAAQRGWKIYQLDVKAGLSSWNIEWGCVCWTTKGIYG